MNLERIGLAAMTLACVGLVGWNLHLRREVTALSARAVESAVQADPAEARAEGVRPRPRDAVERREAPTDRGAGAAPADEGAPATAAAVGKPAEPDWDQVRAQMEANTVDVVEAMGEQHGWTAETTDEVLAILLETGDQIGALWVDVKEGELSHYQARKQMGALRDASGAEIVALIGEPAHEELEEHLFEAKREMWHRGQEGGASDRPPHP